MLFLKLIQSIFVKESPELSSCETQERKTSTKYVLDSVFPNKAVQDEILNRLNNES